MLPAYLINLDRSPLRLAAAVAALARLPVAVERLAAVDGSALTPPDPAPALAALGRALTPGEVGCSLSHLAAARRIVAAGHPVALVFEDDVTVPDGAAADLTALADWIAGRDFDLVNLGRRPSKFVRPLHRLPSGRRLVRAHYFPVTTTALLWSQAGARRFVDRHDLSLPVDVLLQIRLSGTGRGLACAPALFGAAGDSLIGAARSVPSGARLRRQAATYARAASGWLRGSA